jgi:hypothetical protein
MSKYLGDFTAGKTVSVRFNTSKADGTPITLAGTPAISVYKSGSTTESTAGVTLTADYDSRTGLHNVAIDTSADGTFYAAGADYDIVITTGTVDSVSVVGTVVGTFSIANRAALRPTVADRTLDVSAGGEAGIDWANVGSPTTTVGLTGTTISTSQAVASVSSTVSVLLTQTLSAARTLDAVADTALTLNDALHAAIAGAAGKETVLGTAYTVKTPYTGTTIRTFTLDSATTPTSRT